MRSAFATACMFACALASAQDREKYESKDGRYTVEFPGKPMKSTKKAGGVDLSIAIVEKGMGGFAVIHSVLPPEAEKVAKPKELLDGGQKGLIDNFKAKVTSAKDFEFGKEKYPARELIAEKDQLHLRVHVILAEGRLYQVLVVGPKDLIASKEADAFFQSLAIAK